MVNRTTPDVVKEQAHPKRLIFNNPTLREEHIRAFRRFLPTLLQDAPDINWDRLPSPVMGYLIRHLADHPDMIPITFAVGCALHAMKESPLYTSCRYVTQLLQRLRMQYGVSELAQLGTRDIWDQFVARRTLAPGEAEMLMIYNTFASVHVPAHLEGLKVRDHLVWQQYALPPLPTGFLEKYGIFKHTRAGQIQRRKEQSDVLTPLFPLLVEIAQLRKQAAERLIKAFRHQCERALAGEIGLPYHFQYTDSLFTVSRDAPTISSIELVKQEVTLSLTLWDRMSWVKTHPERYALRTQQRSRQQVEAYAPERNRYFLQYKGKTEQLLWCGDLLANWRLCKGAAIEAIQAENPSEKSKKDREFAVSRPGLLSPIAISKRQPLVEVCHAARRSALRA